MKVLIINITCDETSVGRISIDIGNNSIESGDEVVIAYGRGKVSERFKGQTYRIASKCDILWHVFISRFLDQHGFGCKHATQHFVEWIKEYEPDRIILQNIHGYYLNISVLFSFLKEYNGKVTWYLHDCWSFTGHCAHFISLGCKGWLKECNCKCPGRKTYPKVIGHSNNANNYITKKSLFTKVKGMRIVTPCQWLADQVNMSFLKEYEVVVKRNHIDQNIFKPVDSDFREKLGVIDCTIVLAVASVWTDEKGLGDLIKLRSLLSSKTAMIIVGVNKKQIKKLKDLFICVERTNSKRELAAYYSMADYFVNLTHADTYPTVNLEARACGTPIITYDVGGCRETIGEGDFLIKEGNIYEVASIINRNNKSCLEMKEC